MGRGTMSYMSSHRGKLSRPGLMNGTRLLMMCVCGLVSVADDVRCDDGELVCATWSERWGWGRVERFGIGSLGVEIRRHKCLYKIGG